MAFAPPIAPPIAPPSLSPPSSNSGLSGLNPPDFPPLPDPAPFLPPNPLRGLGKLFESLFGVPPVAEGTLPRDFRERKFFNPPVSTPTAEGTIPFKGGQEVGTSYDVYFGITRSNGVTEYFGAIRRVGKIGAVYSEPNSNNTSRNWYYRAGISEANPLGTRYNLSLNLTEGNTWFIQAVVKVNGLDTGGDPPAVGGKPWERGNRLTPPTALGFGPKTAPPPSVPKAPPNVKPPITPRPDEKPDERIKPFPRKPKPSEPKRPPSVPPPPPPVAPPKEKPKTPKAPPSKPPAPSIIPPPLRPPKEDDRTETPKQNPDPKEKPRVIPGPSRENETEQQRLDRENQERLDEKRRKDEEDRNKVGTPPPLTPPNLPPNQPPSSPTSPSSDTGGNNNSGGNENTGGFNPGIIPPVPQIPGTGTNNPAPPSTQPTNPSNGDGNGRGLDEIKDQLKEIEKKIPPPSPPPTPPMTCQELLQCLNSNTETANIKKFVSCNNETKEPVFETVQITVNKGDKAAIEAMAETLANLEGEQCSEKADAIALVPDYWAVRLGQRPQLVVRFQNLLENGTIGKSAWSVAIPHYNRPESFKPKFVSYRRGNSQGILVLSDNSKLIINAFSQTEAKRVISNMKQFIDPEYLKNSQEKYGDRLGVNFETVNVVPISAKFFADGQKNTTPTWSRSVR